MRILQIIPGSGGSFYCQNCLRDLGLTAELRRQGHDVWVMPLYLPLSATTYPGSEASRTPVFYGAVSLYLRHRWPRLHALPAGVWRALDSLPVLRLAARQAGATRADGLAGLTISMLRGEHGGQAAELERLVDWLRSLPASQRPQVISLSNALLLGLARRLRAALGVPIVCWLQDEDVWMNAMSPDVAGTVWDALRDRVADADRFVSVSATYGAAFRRCTGLAAERLRVVHLGVDPAAYPRADPRSDPPTVGYLSRLCAAEGFGTFVDAFIQLRRDPRFSNVRLLATGGSVGDEAFIRQQVRKLAAAGLQDAVVIDPERFQQDRAGFLAELTLLSVPAVRGDAGGLYLVEAMAAGVPTVQPRVGAYPELQSAAGCGTLYAPHTPEALAAAWAGLLTDRARLEDESHRSRTAAEERFSLAQMARQVIELYAELTRPVPS